MSRHGTGRRGRERDRSSRRGGPAVAVVASLVLLSLAVGSLLPGTTFRGVGASPVASSTSATSIASVELAAARNSLDSGTVASPAEVHPAATLTSVPSNRAYTVMAWDPATQQVVLFGGGGFAGLNGPLNISAETWTFTNGSWTELHPLQSPPPTFMASMAYDPNQGALILFGGLIPGNVSIETTTVSNGTNVTVWHTAYDWDRSVVPTGATWEWIDGDWVNVTGPNGPSARSLASLATDPVDGGVVLFGGLRENASAAITEYTFPGNNSWAWNFSSQALVTLGDTWTFTNGSWTNLTASLTASPPTLEDAGFADDPSAAAAVLFGGASGACSAGMWGICGWALENETWLYGRSGWSELGSSSGSPPAATGPALAYVSGPGALLLFGGATSSGEYGETWEFAGEAWTPLTVTNAPPPMDDGGFADDPAAGYALLIVGYTGGEVYPSFETTWTFAGGDWVLTGTNTSLPPQGTVGMTYDVADQDVVAVTPGYPGVAVDDEQTWTYAAGIWTRVNTSVEPPAGGNITYDPEGGYVLYTGEDLQGACYADGGGTWAFSNDTWTELSSGGYCNPAPMVYDAQDGDVLSFNGESTVVWTGSAWVNLNESIQPPADEPIPGTNAMAYDPTAGEALFVNPGRNGSCSGGGAGNESSGNGSSGCPPPGPTGTFLWAFSNGSWENLSSGSTVLPPALLDPSVVWDPAIDGLLMFGGKCAAPPCSPGRLVNETWQFSDGQWSELNLTVAPPPRSDAALAYDAADGYVLLYGGVSCATCLTPLSDTWSFGNGTWSQIEPALQATYAEVDVGVTTELTAVSQGGFNGVSYTYVGLPPGCLSEDTASLACTPSGSGSFDVVVELPAQLATATASTELVVASPLEVSGFSASRTSLTAGTSTVLSVALFGGTAPYELAFVGLPSSCPSENATTLTCTPSVNGIYTVHVAATDRFGRTADASLTLQVGTVGPSPGGSRGFPSSLAPYVAPVAEGSVAGVAVAALALAGLTWRRARLRREGEAIVRELRSGDAGSREPPRRSA
jgi:hypothetical protein